MKKKPYPLARRVGVCVGAAAISATMLTGCNWFNPENNEPVAVYGPPEDFEDYRPEDNEPECVYGPPEWFEPEDNMEADVYGPPPIDDYDPEEELPEPVYGPPEEMP